VKNFDRTDAAPPPAALRLTARQPLVRDVYDVLVDMFMNHTFAPGHRLADRGL
jgi:DNA-binding GntR family transcriptional regulator